MGIFNRFSLQDLRVPNQRPTASAVQAPAEKLMASLAGTNSALRGLADKYAGRFLGCEHGGSLCHELCRKICTLFEPVQYFWSLCKYQPELILNQVEKKQQKFGRRRFEKPWSGNHHWNQKLWATITLRADTYEKKRFFSQVYSSLTQSKKPVMLYRNRKINEEKPLVHWPDQMPIPRRPTFRNLREIHSEPSWQYYVCFTGKELGCVALGWCCLTKTWPAIFFCKKNYRGDQRRHHGRAHVPPNAPAKMSRLYYKYRRLMLSPRWKNVSSVCIKQRNAC